MMTRTVKLAALLPVAGLLFAAVSLPADAARDRNIGNAVVRDHGPKPIVRDHRGQVYTCINGKCAWHTKHFK